MTNTYSNDLYDVRAGQYNNKPGKIYLCKSKRKDNEKTCGVVSKTDDALEKIRDNLGENIFDWDVTNYELKERRVSR